MKRIVYICSGFQTIMHAFINIMRYFPILVNSFKNYCYDLNPYQSQKADFHYCHFLLYFVFTGTNRSAITVTRSG